MATLCHSPPPSADDSHLLNHLLKSLSTVESIFPNSGVILLGDFNKLNISRLKNNFKLKQIFKFATRGQNKLDLILTNLKDYYENPTTLPPFGLSDHVTVKVLPLKRSATSTPKTRVKVRDMR